MNRSWYVFRIQNNISYNVTSELSNIGLSYYLPVIKHTNEQAVTSYKPLFSGYIFIQSDNLEKHSHLISKIKGIYGCLFQDSLPAIIEDDFISKLRHKVSDINHLGGVWKTYTAGDKVLLEVHGLSKIGTVIQHSMSDKTRVRILIDFMGKEIKAEVNWFNLTSYESSKKNHKLHNRRRTRGRNRPIKQLIAA
ncbi:MAG: hypothetical protein FI726_02215 [SAR202 cluster bacterium]|nr:hypothetical protein [SAR202 cluster bacterium]|tara:strand:+ start:730 stop:1308 length:579 start_codon:yes stop_codon:yes gene_type:complete